MKYYFPLIAIFFAIGCTPAKQKTEVDIPQNKFADSTLVNIHEWKDHRHAQDLILMLDHENALYRAEAAMALASCMDTVAVASLCIALNDSVDQVAENAAYALGQTASTESGYSLMNHIEENQSISNSAIFWEALGSCADSAVAPRILTYLQTHDYTEGASRGLYRLALRRLISAEHAPALAKQIKLGNTDDVLLAIHSVIRSKEVDFIVLDTLLSSELNSSNLDIRIAAAAALGKIPSEYNRPHLEYLLHNPGEDTNVLISALRSYRRHENLDTAIVAAMIHHPNRDVALTACSLLGNMGKDETWISQNIATPSDPWVEAKVLTHMPEFVVEHSERLMEQMETQQNQYARAAWIRSLSQDPSLALEMQKIMLDTSVERIVSTAACESLIAMSSSSSWDSDYPFIEVIKKGVATGDITVLAILSGHIAENADDYRSQSDFTFLEESLSMLTLPRDIETHYEIQKALCALKQETWERPAPMWNHSIDWEYIKSLPANHTVKVVTNRGDYLIELDIENAPATASNFLDLVDKGYYTNKLFHRVVPNFVIQTGCPRGDGYGSVPYSIRSELDLHDYRTGACGMASAGNDTESCQWFVTHSPTPHLEGRYSIFGYVTQGMDVVNAIHEGDTIFSISHE